jgi:hypothetical protein
MLPTIKKTSRALILTGIFALCTARLAAQSYSGYTLYGPNGTRYTYLIDMANTRVHTWSSTRTGGYAAYLLADGSILRTADASSRQLNGGGATGTVQRIAWDGTLLWEHTHSSSTYCLHHDICPMPNGNVLMISWEVKTSAECVANGLDHTASIWPDKIIEVQPVGSSGGNIVWEWHAWDHLIQNHDASKANYGVISNHPELLDINAGAVTSGDWMHLNSVDYNPDLDQIVVSSHNLNEVYVIDHSTTTAQAASHSGGNAGKGGDFLYRWGCPSNYGISGTTYFNVVHCGSWIASGLPGAGHIMAFNNRSGTNSSIIAEIETPLNGYAYNWTAGQPYAPASPAWTYSASGFYSQHLGGVQRLPNGNTLIAQSLSGKMFEVTSSGTMVWSYTPGGEIVRCYRYAPSYSGILLGGSTPKVSKVEVSAPTILWPTVSIPFRVTCQDTIRYNLQNSYFTITENGSLVSNVNISCPGSGTGFCTLTYTTSCPDGSSRPISFRFSGYCSLDTTVVQYLTIPRDTAAFTPVHLALGSAAVEDLTQATVPLLVEDALSGASITPATFDVGFDRALVDFVSIATPAGTLLSGQTITANATAEGMSFSIPSAKALTASGTLAQLTFRRVADGATVQAPLHLANWTFASAACMKALHGDGSVSFTQTQRMAASMPDSSTLDFGEVVLGSSSHRSVIVSSTGKAALTLNGLAFTGTNAIDFSGGGSFRRAVAAGKGDTLTLAYTPTAVGASNAVATLTCDDPTTPVYTVFLTGSCILTAHAPVISCSVSDGSVLDFGSVYQDSVSRRNLVISNTGDIALAVSGETITGANAGDFAVTRGKGAHSIAPGASDTLALSFTGSAAGARSATLAISSNDSTRLTYRVQLGGNCLVLPRAPRLACSVADGDTLRFGTVVEDSSAVRTLLLSNTGNAALTVTGESITGANAGDFTVTGGGGQRSIAPGATDTLRLTFTWTATGARAASLAIASNDSLHSPWTVVLAGTGAVVDHLVTCSAASLDFGTVTVGSQSTRGARFSNAGRLAAAVLSQRISGGDSARFTITRVCPSPLGAGSTDSVVIRFSPTAAGVFGSQLQFRTADTGAGRLLTVALRGTGTTAQFPVFTLAADTLRFDSTLVGTPATASLTVANPGSAPLVVQSQAISGAAAAEFSSATTLPRTVQPGDSAHLSYTFAASAPGTAAALLRLTSNDTANPAATVVLLASATAPPVLRPSIRVSALAIDFGTVDVGASRDTTITLSNAGTADLALTAQSLAGADPAQFSLRAPAASLIAPSQSAQAQLRFAPSATGAKSAVFRVQSNDSTALAIDVALTGTGAQPTGIGGVLPATLALEQNHPNPFGPASPSGSAATILRWTLPAAGDASVAVHDVYGRLVATVAAGWMDAGSHAARLDAGALPSGTYYCRLAAGGRVVTRGMLLLR